jgi:hypothetical protein
MDSDDRTNELIEKSSLGAKGARGLRGRTNPKEAAAVRDLERLTRAVQEGEWWQLAPLARAYQKMGHLERAEELLRRMAAIGLEEIAALRRARGDQEGALTWHARAKTLGPTESPASESDRPHNRNEDIHGR